MRILTRALCLFALCSLVRPALADEIQLKDGKTFYGTIVGFDNKMFKVKTDFGFIYIAKDKIASIIPNKAEGSQPAAASDAANNGANGKASNSTNNASGANANSGTSKSAAPAQRTPQPEAQSVKAIVAQPTAAPAVETIVEPPAPRISSAAVRPQLPTNAPKTKAVAPSIKSMPEGTAAALAAPTAAQLTPPPNEIPQIPEEVQGNTYTNHIYGFRMYKAPSWQLIDDPTELPNAIVAMGTQNESTLLVVGREKTKQPLDSAANTVEKRLQDVYSDYQKTSQRKTTIGGLPAVEYRYRGKADDHDWSGTLVVVARGTDIFTALGMTFANTDLIQIQENVIAKAISSLDFNVR